MCKDRRRMHLSFGKPAALSTDRRQDGQPDRSVSCGTCGGEVAPDAPECLGKRAVDHVDPMHDTVTLRHVDSAGPYMPMACTSSA